MQVSIEVYARSLTQLVKKRKRKRHDAIHQPTTLVFNSERVNSRPRIKGRGYEICRCCSKAIMEPGCRYYYARCVSRTTERSGERTNSRASALVQGRFGMLITDQHTYPSLAPLRLTAPCHGLPRLPADSSWNGPHRRSRCTQGSRETDESTLRPETLVLPSFELAARAARWGEPGSSRLGSSSLNRLLCASSDFFRRRLTWSSDRQRQPVHRKYTAREARRIERIVRI